MQSGNASTNSHSGHEAGSLLISLCIVVDWRNDFYFLNIEYISRIESRGSFAMFGRFQKIQWGTASAYMFFQQ